MKTRQELMNEVIEACESLLSDDGGVIGHAFGERLCDEGNEEEGNLLAEVIEEVEEGFSKVLKTLKEEYIEGIKTYWVLIEEEGEAFWTESPIKAKNPEEVIRALAAIMHEEQSEDSKNREADHLLSLAKPVGDRTTVIIEPAPNYLGRSYVFVAFGTDRAEVALAMIDAKAQQ